MILVDKNDVPCHCQRIKFSYTNYWLEVTWINGKKFFFEPDELVRTGVDLLQPGLTRDQWHDAYTAAEKFAEENMAKVYGPEKAPTQETVH